MSCWAVGSAVLPSVPRPLSPIPSRNGDSPSTGRGFPVTVVLLESLISFSHCCGLILTILMRYLSCRDC